MFGMWKIKALKGKDSRDAANLAEVVSCMNEAIEGTLYLPPYLRPNQCNIDAGCVVVGFLDDVTGKGAAFCGIDAADYGYFLDSKFEIKQKLTVGDDIEASGDVSSGGVVSCNDCKAGNVSLSMHTHNYTCSFTGATVPTQPPQ